MQARVFVLCLLPPPKPCMLMVLPQRMSVCYRLLRRRSGYVSTYGACSAHPEGVCRKEGHCAMYLMQSCADLEIEQSHEALLEIEDLCKICPEIPKMVSAFRGCGLKKGLA